jgi:predicted P-loop ATPase
MELDISFGKHRADTNWKVEYLTWDEFVQRLRKIRRTSETMAEYDRMSAPARDKVKNGPAFVGGFIRGGRRKKQNVESRSLITLDADHADEDFLFAAELALGGHAYVVYSTHSHRPHKPKYRLVAPANRRMSPDEYGAVTRKIADWIGMHYFDRTTFDVHRLMYLPSCSKDAEPVLEVYEGDPIDVDAVLAEYDDWRDVMSWPRHPEDSRPERQPAKKMEDPHGKQGLVGAFCRCYTISQAIATFLPDVYEPVDDSLTRYTYVHGTGHGGLVVYDNDTFAYSHHQSDPVGGREVNAFDLVRIHKFGHLDDDVAETTNITKLPSYAAMCAFAAQDPAVKRLMTEERQREYEEIARQLEEESDDDEEDDDSWMELLERHKRTGEILPTPGNIEIILSRGEWKGVLAYDEFANTEVIRKDLPWRKRLKPDAPYEPWLAEDDRRLRHWFGKKYNIRGAAAILDAFTEVTRRRRFHPIKEYLESQVWDGVQRAERIFITYLGAADTHYVRQVTRKMLLAAVTRLYRPGCKFDQMLVLIGPQGAGKSSLLAKLGRKWFSDSLRTFENKEAGEHLQNGWIFEISELSAMKRSEVEEVKAFLSKTEDRYRVAYDRQVSEFPRKCVFFGTTNTRDFLRDTTGNRRFWPVEVDPKNAMLNHWDHLTDELVGQIWAEVLTWFRAGEGLELDQEAREEAERQQAAHTEIDPREGLIQEWLESEELDEMDRPTGKKRQRVCVAQIWVECLGKRRGDMKSWEAKEIMDIMRRMPGWVERKGKAKIPGYGVQRVFERVNQQEGEME